MSESPVQVSHAYFSDESVARAEIEAAGYHPLTISVPAQSKATHWHDFDSLIFILDGEVTITVADSGERCVCRKGTKVVAPARVAHSEETEGYELLLGVSCPPAQMTRPLNKPLPM